MYKGYIAKHMVMGSLLVLLAGCSKLSGHATGDMAGDTFSNGLGKFAHFAGQVPGESYTTQAPHNQIYLFSYDDSNLNPKYDASLSAQARYMKDHPHSRVLLAGHTDERGSREYNVSYGKERPANYGHDEASHRQNRRVELIYEATE